MKPSKETLDLAYRLKCKQLFGGIVTPRERLLLYRMVSLDIRNGAANQKLLTVS